MNTIQRNFQSVLGVTTLLVLGACANGQAPFYPTSSTVPQAAGAYTQYGVVQSIELVQQQATTGTGTGGVGAGAIAGAVVGGLLGHQVGGGSGNTVATVLGAAGGAYAGHSLEKNQLNQPVNAYQFTVRLTNGSYQTYTQATNTDIRVGDRVQIDNGLLRRY